jgi:hypothetical protein
VEPAYRNPLEQTSRQLAERLPADAQAVLLGSVATDKYVTILSEVFGERLVFPQSFIGRGDMSRGGLLLRSIDAGTELEYVRLDQVASRNGARPPKLGPVSRPAFGETG